MEMDRGSAHAVRRGRVPEADGVVYTVATAGAPGRSVQEQTRLALEAIDSALADAGSDRSHLLSVHVFMSDVTQKAAMDEVWNEWIGTAAQSCPHRACVRAPLAANTLVEIVVTAAKA